MRTIYFATGNKGKAKEVEQILGVDIKIAKMDLDEIQSLSPKAIIKHKLEQAYEKLKSPVIVDDVSLEMDVWDKFPGPLVKYLHGKDTKRILYMLRNEKNRNGTLICTVGYHDGKKMHAFTGKLRVRIAKKNLGENGWGLDPILIHNEKNLTLAQMTDSEKNTDSHRGRAFLMLKRFLDSKKGKKDI